MGYVKNENDYLMIVTAAKAMLVCGGVSANEVESTVALSTDYVFRGIYQTNEYPATSIIVSKSL